MPRNPNRKNPKTPRRPKARTRFSPQFIGPLPQGASRRPKNTRQSPIYRGPQPTFADREYIASLLNPWEIRQVRIPTPFVVSTASSTYHGNITFTANAAGFANVILRPSYGTISVYNDVAHTETNLGAANLLYTAGYAALLGRVVNAGIKVRSLASWNSESGYMQAYVRLGAIATTYDLARDTPQQQIYSKGEVAKVVYLPCDTSYFTLAESGSYIGNSSNSSHHLGVLIVGAAANQPFTIQYAITVEYTNPSAANSDSTPLKTAPVGNAKVHVAVLHGTNAAAAPTLAQTGSGFALSGAQTGAAIGSFFGPVGAAVGGALGGAVGYFQSTSSIPGGNRTQFQETLGR